MSRQKIILVGYPGSQCIVPASKYLTEKYLPGFDITYLNYKGPIDGWAAYVRGYLEYLTDKHVIFALDDYLVSGPMDEQKFSFAQDLICEPFCVCVKLCHCTPEENEEYPITTQYSLWDREYLIRMLGVMKTPWEFEIKGSEIHISTEGKSNSWYASYVACLPYFTNSSLSAKWEGVRLDGLKDEDFNYIKQHGLLTR